MSRWRKRITNSRFYNFLVRIVSVRFRSPVEVRVVHLSAKGEIIEPKKAEPINIKACILEEDKQQERKIQKIGDSYYVSFPEGWLKSISNSEKVRERLILTNGNERMIIISKLVEM